MTFDFFGVSRTACCPRCAQGLRVANFYEPGRRQRGQLSLEEAMARRGQQQQQQASPEGQAEHGLDAVSPGGHSYEGSHMEPQHAQLAQQQEWDMLASEEDGWGFCGGSDEEEVHSSLALDGGEPVELTLRDWQPAAQPAEPQRQQQQQHDNSLSLAVPLANAADAEQEAVTPAAPSGAAAAAKPAAPGGGGGRPVHMPQTIMDVLAQQAADSMGHQAGTSAQPAQGHQQVPAPPPTWACPACTFENPRANFWCQMCSTSRHGRAPRSSVGGSGVAAGGSSIKPASSAASRAGGSSSSKTGIKRGRKSSVAAAGGAPSILRFMSRQASPPAQEQQPAQQQHAQEQQQEQQQRAEQQQQQPCAGIAAAGAAGGAGPAEGAEAGASTAWGADQAGPSRAAGPGGAEEGEGGLFSGWGVDEGEHSDEGELLPGEDWLECQHCRHWVRGSRIQVGGP